MRGEFKPVPCDKFSACFTLHITLLERLVASLCCFEFEAHAHTSLYAT
jgi:hypothetical protein